METLLYSAFRAVRSLFTPGMMIIFIQSILLTVAALVGFVFASSAFFTWLAHALQGHAVLSSILPWLGGVGSTMVAWMLFPGIMPILVSFFDDRIALIIEERDYPESSQPATRDFWRELWHDVRFSLLAVGLNILVLPLYLLPGLNLILFYWLNGYLLGREFFSMVARRHMPVRESDAAYRRHSMLILTAGLVLAVLATIPIANLFAPFWGIAVMVHLYHRVEPTAKVEYLSPQIPHRP